MRGSTVGLMQDSMRIITETATTSYARSSVFTNYPLMSAFLAFAIAQAFKFIAYCSESLLVILGGVNWYKENRWDFKLLIGSGGMPSSHSATVTALSIAVGLQEGFGGSQFATALVLACVVMYDASGIRLHAGRQAEVLNQILCELPAEHPLADSRPLRELLGHTPTQVAAGVLLGLVMASLIYLICGSSLQARSG